MDYIEFARNTLPCGTLVYSYMLCRGGYLINILNLDTNSSCTTAGVDIPREYMLEIMGRMVSGQITEDTMNDFLLDEVNRYFDKFPPKPAKSKRRFLYL